MLLMLLWLLLLLMLMCVVCDVIGVMMFDDDIVVGVEYVMVDDGVDLVVVVNVVVAVELHQIIMWVMWLM